MGKDTVDNAVTWRCRGLNVIETQRDLRSILQPGMALLYDAFGGSTRYYGKVLSITASRIFIAGASLFVASDMTFCYYSKYPLIQQVELYIDGTYGDGIDASLLANDMNKASTINLIALFSAIKIYYF